MITVLDASVLAASIIPDEASDRVTAVLARASQGGFAAPMLLQLELANVLLGAVRAKRVSATDLLRLVLLADELPIQWYGLLTAAERGEMLGLARRHGLSAYDATYLELAIRLDARLATLDRSLARAARAEGVPVVP